MYCSWTTSSTRVGPSRWQDGCCERTVLVRYFRCHSRMRVKDNEFVNLHKYASYIASDRTAHYGPEWDDKWRASNAGRVSPVCASTARSGACTSRLIGKRL